MEKKALCHSKEAFHVIQVFAIFRSGFHQVHFLMRTLKGKIRHGALRQSNGSIPLASIGITLCQLGAWLHPNLPQPSHSSAASVGQNEGPARCSFLSSLTTGKGWGMSRNGSSKPLGNRNAKLHLFNLNLHPLRGSVFLGTNQTVCKLEENKDESENLCQDKSRAKGLKTFQSF